MTELRDCTVAVLFGGSSGEREVSIDTGREVCRALEQAREAGFGPRAVLPVEWEADGAWSWGESRAADRAEALARLPDVDLFFLGVHGGDGENGVIQAALDDAGRAYTGSRAEASRGAMDKTVARARAAAAGLRTGRALCLTEEDWARGTYTQDLRAFYASGMVVKPRRGGSSIATSLVESAGELAEAVEAVFASGDEALVEERLRGIEVTCGVLGNAGEELRALVPVEIRPHEGRFFDYEEKYSQAGALELCPPESLVPIQLAELRAAACSAHAALGCDGYSRSDFFYTDAGLVYLETNTLPGFTARSLMPQAAAADGMGFPELCCWIASAALRVFSSSELGRVPGEVHES